jgi:hypothetical protein
MLRFVNTKASAEGLNRIFISAVHAIIKRGYP